MAGQPNLLYPSPSEAAVPGNTLATVSGGGMTAAAEQRLQLDAKNMAIMPKTAQLSLRAQGASQMFTGTLNTEGRK